MTLMRTRIIIQEKVIMQSPSELTRLLFLSLFFEELFIGFLIESVLSDFFLNSILGVEANLGTNIHNTICNFKSK